jgi:hypothetical protein
MDISKPLFTNNIYMKQIKWEKLNGSI